MRRRLVVVLLLMLVVALGIHALLWNMAAEAVRTGLEDWVAELEAAGGSARAEAVRLGGYPTRLALDAHALEVTLPDGTRLLAPRSRAEAQVHDWRRIDLDLAHESTVLLGGGLAAAARAEKAGGTVLLDEANRVKTVSITLAGLMLSAEAGATDGLAIAGAELLITPLPPNDEGLEVTRLTLDLRDLRPVGGQATLAGPLDRLVDRIELVADQIGTLPAEATPPALTRWRDRGGRIELTNLAVSWDPLRLEASGDIALDDELQPAAGLTARLSGYNAALDTLVAEGVITGDAATTTRLVLNLMARPDPETGDLVIESPLIVANGRLSLGGVDFAEIPRLDWAEGTHP